MVVVLPIRSPLLAPPATLPRTSLVLPPSILASRLLLCLVPAQALLPAVETELDKAYSMQEPMAPIKATLPMFSTPSPPQTSHHQGTTLPRAKARRYFQIFPRELPHPLLRTSHLLLPILPPPPLAHLLPTPPEACLAALPLSLKPVRRRVARIVAMPLPLQTMLPQAPLNLAPDPLYLPPPSPMPILVLSAIRMFNLKARPYLETLPTPTGEAIKTINNRHRAPHSPIHQPPEMI